MSVPDKLALFDKMVADLRSGIESGRVEARHASLVAVSSRPGVAGRWGASSAPIRWDPAASQAAMAIRIRRQ
jgi:hypothetical protein